MQKHELITRLVKHRCGCLSGFEMLGTDEEATKCTWFLALYPCHLCDHSRKPIIWLDRQAVEYMIAERERLWVELGLPKSML